MGFLKKIFKKKKKGSSDAPQPWIPENRNAGQDVVQATRTDSNTQTVASNAIPLSYKSPTRQPSTIRDERNADSELEPGRIVPRKGYDIFSTDQNGSANGWRPVDENHNHSNAGAVQIDMHNIQQSERQHDNLTNRPVYQPVFKMSAQVPRQQMIAMDEIQSYGSSSSFNLSTDAEDSEYENLRSRGVLPGTNLSSLDMSMSMSISAASNPTSIAGTDQETVFPALNDMTIQSATMGSNEQSRTSVLDPVRSQQEEMKRKLGFMPPYVGSSATDSPTPEDEPGYIPSATKNDRDLHSWVLSPSTEDSNDRGNFKGYDSNPNDPLSTQSAGSNHFFGFNEKSIYISHAMVKHKARRSQNTTSRNFPGIAPRNFTSPKSQASSSTGFSDGFADFEDFGSSNEWGKGAKDPTTSARGDFDRSFENFRSTNSTHQQQVSATFSSQGQTERSLSELLALAKSKDRNNASSPNTPNRSMRTPVAIAPVGSTPEYSSSYLRQFHTFGKYNKGGYDREGMKPTSPRISNEETSVSDIIQRLEVSNQMRRHSGKLNSSRSIGDVSSTSISRLARERSGEKRRKGYQSSGVRSSDESDVSDNGASESWLFDGVAGALGPRGIAADLESLSGRSSRSKNSRGNRSHRSRQSRSRNSSSRKPRTSNESISSRESRYSHRSTRSFISQMSEQSKSVANDLLRLEMQLAMVGQENRDDIPVLGGGNSVVRSTKTGESTSRHRSRGKSSSSSSQRRKSSFKRSKVSVVAPPGKLGIILANKADAQGTVVSGVRSSSALVNKISPGDRIIAIDGEDVSKMSVKEITIIMSRKAEYERNLTVLTLNKYNDFDRHRGATVEDRQHHEQEYLS